MSCLKCKPPIRPRNLGTPLCDLYRDRLSELELAEVSHRSMQLMKDRLSFGLQDASSCWSEALLSLLLQKGWLRSLEQIEADESKKT